MSTARQHTKRLEQFVGKTLLEELGCPGRRFTLQETGLGIHNLVCYLDIDGYKSLVMKCVRKRDRFKTLLACSEHLRAQGIPIPATIYVREDPRLLGRLGFHLICEERIAGKTLFELGRPDELVTEAARLFGRLHSVKRREWGKIASGKNGGLYAYLKNKIQEKLTEWKRCDREFPADFSEAVSAFCERYAQEVDTLASFSLCHCDPNPGNIIADSTGKLFLLDTDNIRYLPRAIDYFMLKFNLCEDDESKMKLFEDAYREHLSGEDDRAFTVARPFFKVYVFITFAAMLAGRLAVAQQGDPYMDDYVRFLKRAKEQLVQCLYN